MNGALSFHELTVGYGGEPVLHDVSFALEPGEIVALLGANGAGKTTLLRALAGFVRPLRGGIRLDGDDLARLSPEDRARRGIAQVPEGRSVVAELTVDENLRLGALWRHRGRARETAIAEIYDLFEPLARRRSADGHQLSGGERQMLALGRALVSRPRVLTLDEPSLGLAPLVVAQLMATLRDAAARDDMTVLLAEQNITSALSIADRGVVLDLGRIVADAAASALADDTALRHAYLGF
ncbi:MULTISPECIES: ABC transporter ATP-binding protein [unclassified Microbacterium]|uniref:ABC transporter ATP-binding protein n=1 Tax=unclassified Microbacterium TaxID=2609290 RepID=UPI00214BE3DC|nr:MULTISPECIES: ABC transporter ATP-binding protein [unclassified Microbacterium]MCR2800357.1 ABC transporter ATP-binding protein [Microbacterium sp. zg.Y818]MCR2827657.1 ABC transporter ATP-binding protein [Microbacterium sp. zg.Y909]WIM22317.1 ABC transporter ATP-binding protein [Microbacterium sp. zg-Y818]